MGAATRALLGIVRDGVGERELAGQICRACTDGLDVDGAALSLLTASEARVTLAATDPVAQLIEELQFTFNEGACIEAASTGRPVLVPDLHHSAQTARWPGFAGAVAERTEVSALFALPLQWGAVNLGVLDLYRIVPGGLDGDQWRDAVAAVDMAALLILGRRTDPGLAVTDAARAAGTHLGAGPGTGNDSGNGNESGAGNGSYPALDSWLDEAVGYRAEVYQATGMVLAQLGVSATDALARMRGHAFAHQLLLVDVARAVVARRLVFSDEM